MTQARTSNQFNRNSAKPARKRPAPFSIRLSEEERAVLERRAGEQPLGAYIRARLLDDPDCKRASRKTDYALLGKILGLLGKSELASSLCLLAVAAEAGALPVSEEVESELQAACRDVRDMRVLLVRALGLRP